MFLLTAIDPYVSVECEGEKMSTVVKKDTESAKYDNGALFYVKKPDISMVKIKVRLKLLFFQYTLYTGSVAVKTCV